MTTGSADGYIRIDTKVDSGGLTNGLKKVKMSFKDLTQMAFGFGKGLTSAIGPAISEKLKTLSGTLKNVFKALSIGSLLVFGVALRNIFQSVRESITSLINTNLKGSQLGKDIEGVKNQFTELKFSVAAAFLPLIQFAIPYIKQALDWLIKLFNQAAMFAAAFTGQKEVLQVVAGSAGDLAKNTEKAAKAARGALAAFDQINVLQQPDAGAAGATSTDAMPSVLTNMVPVTDEILAKVQAIKDTIMAWWNDPIGMIQETWGKITEWFKTNVTDPIKEWWMSTWLGQEVSQLWDQLKSEFIDPFSAGFYTMIESTKELFSGLWSIITDDSTTIPEKIIASFTLLNDWLLANFKPGIDNLLSSMFVDPATGENFKTNILDPMSVGFFEFIESTKVLFDDLWTTISDKSLSVPEKLKAIFGSLVEWFKVNIAPGLQNAFGGTLDWIGDKFQTIFAGVKDFARDAINAIIGFVNGMIDSVVSGLNSIISAANAIGGILPGFQAISPVSGIQIPQLATGAVIPPNSKFMAVLGDQKSGTNIEAPADLIRQIIREEMGNAGGGELTVNMPVYLDSEKIYDGQQKVQTRRGSSLISSGAIA